MSLLSLLIALMAEKSLSSSVWCFDYYYQKYVDFFYKNTFITKFNNNNLSHALFIVCPVVLVYCVLSVVGNGLLHLIISTLILIVTIGCVTIRKSYKQYLHAAFNGDTTTAELHHQQLLQDKNLPSMSFGQALIWLNYRYYIAIMLFFIIFGAVGAVFYRLLTSIVEQQNKKALDTTLDNNNSDGVVQAETAQEIMAHQASADHDLSTSQEETVDYLPQSNSNTYQNILFYLDWLPVRFTSFGYMFVGHFSKAFPMWLEDLFDAKKPAHEILIDVAEKSEDIMLDNDDCTAEPCLLVRLAKRNLLLVLAFIAVLTLIGLVN